MTEKVRPEVRKLANLGPMPGSSDVLKQNRDTEIASYERLILSIKKPISDSEARELVKLFGPDDAFGLAWTLVALIESAPSWPLYDLLTDSGNEWISLLRQRAEKTNQSSES